MFQLNYLKGAFFRQYSTGRYSLQGLVKSVSMHAVLYYCSQISCLIPSILTQSSAQETGCSKSIDYHAETHNNECAANRHISRFLQTLTGMPEGPKEAYLIYFLIDFYFTK